MRIVFVFWWMATAAFYAAADDKPLSEVRVLGIIASDYHNRMNASGPADSIYTNYARPGDRILLHVDRLWVLRTNAAALGRRITLFIDGVEMTNLSPQPKIVPIPKATAGATTTALRLHGIDPTNILSFRLKRSDANSDLWRGLLNKPFAQGLWQTNVRPYPISIGLQRGIPVASEEMLNLVVYEPRLWTISWFCILVLIVAGFTVLSAKTELLRDSGPVPEQGSGRRSYSLAKVQLAWWTMILVVSSVLIYMVTDDMNPFNAQALLLMTISGATWASATGIGKSAPRGRYNRSEFWLRDILSDDDGISFQRFQMVTWNLLLGIMFLVTVVNDLTMPEFSATLLTLMGLSAGTYVTSKFPSMASRDDPAADPKLTLKNPTASKRQDGKTSFKVDPCPEATSYELWVKSENATQFTRLEEILSPTGGYTTGATVEHNESMPPGKTTTYKWRAMKNGTTGPYTDAQVIR